MKINSFKIERFFARYEFKAKYLMSSSDCDGLALDYLIGLASPEDLNAWNSIKLGYSETRGSLMLRKAISQHYNNIGPDNIVVCSPGEANFALMNTLLDKGDEVVCISPSYQSLYEIPLSLGCKISFWEAEYRNKKWYFNPDRLRKLITRNTRLIIINFPHNPTGYTPPVDEFNEIVKIASDRGITLFSDEMYRFLTHDPHNEIPSACDLYDNAVSLWGTSKSFGLAGLRLGWITTRNSDILNMIEAYKDYLSICNSPATEIPAAIALNNAGKIIGNNISRIVKNTGLFREFAERNKGFLEFPVPDSGSTAFVPLKLKIPALDFAEKVVKETGILLLPSETFNYGSNHIRIGFGKESFIEGLEHFEKYLDKEEIKELCR